MNRWRGALRLTGVGFFIGGSIALGVFGGLWLDNKLGTGLFWVAGLILGLVVAFYGVYQMLVPLMRSEQDKENN
ncbi:MAG: AtpZ/AtpI family protein [Dehalococcoidia bacterium]|nr:AtpZ/AtpI family protein [Dehalococcoidia bacterium]